MKAIGTTLCLVGLLGSLLVGCAASAPQLGFKLSGFLGDYSRLAASDASGALHSYRNPNASAAAYPKLFVESVTIWKAAGSTAGDIPRSDLRRIAGIFRQQLAAGLAESFELVDEPGQGVLRLRAAVSEKGPSNVAMDIASSANSKALTALSGIPMSPETRDFVASAAAEVELSDSQTGAVILSVADTTAIGAGLLTAADPWPALEGGYVAWTARLRGWLGVSERVAEQPASKKP